jgi:xanthine dehydrogenase accessory factor
MRDVLPTLERWIADGRRVVVATVVERQGSAPRDPGASMAINDKGEVAGSVTGGCVEPAVIREAHAVLAGGPAKVVTYGIADDEAFDVGLSCGGTVAILIFPLDSTLVAPIAEAVAADRAVALALPLGDAIGEQRLVSAEGRGDAVSIAARALLEVGDSAVVRTDSGDLVFVESFAPRPRMYVFGAVDHASALVTMGKFLGYRVSVCDARALFVTADRAVALALPLGDAIGEQRLVSAEGRGDAVSIAARALLEVGDSAVVQTDSGDLVFVESFAPRPHMYVFGAVDHASALVTMGKFLGYRVSVCDARALFVTADRFPDADELVVDWPDRFLERSPVDARTAICVLTHDSKFDVPALKAALQTNAGYIGAMGSQRTREERRERLLAEGVGDVDLVRVHAPIGLQIGGRTPEEVAVAIAAQLIESQTVARRSPGVARATVISR